MANPSKQAGTAWESVVEEYHQQVGLPAKRTGSADHELGDIHAAEWTLECKAEKVIDLPGYLKQLAAAVERRQTPAYKSLVWVKNRRHGVKDAYAVMSGENARSLMVYVTSLEQCVRDMTAAFLEFEQEGRNGS